MCYSVQTDRIENTNINKDCCIEFNKDGKKGFFL